MNRSARIGGLLALILLICGAVIVLDQTRAHDSTSPGAGTTNTAPAQTTTPPSSNDGYGDLK